MLWTDLTANQTDLMMLRTDLMMFWTDLMMLWTDLIVNQTILMMLRNVLIANEPHDATDRPDSKPDQLIMLWNDLIANQTNFITATVHTSGRCRQHPPMILASGVILALITRHRDEALEALIPTYIIATRWSFQQNFKLFRAV